MSAQSRLECRPPGVQIEHHFMLFRELNDTERECAGIIADRGYSATREQAMADFKAQWLDGCR